MFGHKLRQQKEPRMSPSCLIRYGYSNLENLVVMQFEISVLLRVLCVSVVVIFTPFSHHGGREHGEAEKTETASVPSDR